MHPKQDDVEGVPGSGASHIIVRIVLGQARAASCYCPPHQPPTHLLTYPLWLQIPRRDPGGHCFYSRSHYPLTTICQLPTRLSYLLPHLARRESQLHLAIPGIPKSLRGLGRDPLATRRPLTRSTQHLTTTAYLGLTHFVLERFQLLEGSSIFNTTEPVVTCAPHQVHTLLLSSELPPVSPHSTSVSVSALGTHSSYSSSRRTTAPLSSRGNSYSIYRASSPRPRGRLFGLDSKVPGNPGPSHSCGIPCH